MNKNFLYGAVIKLTREDTLTDIEQNFIQMREAGFNTAVVWPASFWWEEKREGYPFNTGRALLEIAERHGLSIIMELAGQLPSMEYIPDFRMKEEYYCTDEHGHKRLKHGSFGYLNYFHPEVNGLICENFSDTARAYKDYPALIAYDVFNETAFNSYDNYTLERFRGWLKQKYGSIERLNEVWEHCYTDFSQIGFTPWMWMSIMPAADIGAFRKESVGMFLKDWCDAIRAVDPTHPLIADNVGSMITNGNVVYERPQDDFALKDAVDEIGMSFYPKQVKGTHPPHKRWAAFDAYYAASGREGFYVSEMQTHTQALFNPNTAVRPYELKQWCTEALASGAKGLIYWMWRPFTKGLQTAGRGLVDYKNRSTPRLELAENFGRLLEETGALTPLRGSVGILFDGQCQDFQTFYTKCYNVDQNVYLNSLCGAYRAFYDAGVRADIVKLHEIERYPFLILSNHIVIGTQTAKALENYVRSGGILLCDGKIGIVDEWSMLNGEQPGGCLNTAMGLETIDTDYESLDFTYEGKPYRGYYGRELTVLCDGQCKGSFADGYPAVVEHTVGKGRIITVNTYLWYGYQMEGNDADAFADAMAERFGLRQITAAAPLRVRVSENDHERYAFVFNYTNATVTGRVCGCGFDENVTVEANGVIVVKRENGQI